MALWGLGSLRFALDVLQGYYKVSYIRICFSMKFRGGVRSYSFSLRISGFEGLRPVGTKAS